MIFSLYQGSVENARFEIFIPMLDEVSQESETLVTFMCFP